MEIFEKVEKMLKSDSKSGERVTVTEALSSTDAVVLIPQVITGVLKEAAEPVYVAGQLLQKIQLTEGKLIEFPNVGALRAHDIAEGGQYPEESLDFSVERVPVDVKVGKVGLMVKITDEMISDSQWDVIGMHLRAAGRAMARYKEEKIFKDFSLHGHTVFDNDIRVATPAAGTTGRNKIGEYNNTLSLEDFFDMVIAMMINEKVTTDVLMHPMAWVSYAKTGMFGGLAGPAAGASILDLPTNALSGSDAIRSNIPFGINVLLSPFIPLDRETKKMDMYVVDRNEVGVLVVKDELSTEDFADPMRDLRRIKVKERYGIGILDEGRGVVVAKNIALAPTFPFGYNVTLNIDDDRVMNGA